MAARRCVAAVLVALAAAAAADARVTPVLRVEGDCDPEGRHLDVDVGPTLPGGAAAARRLAGASVGHRSVAVAASSDSVVTAGEVLERGDGSADGRQVFVTRHAASSGGLLWARVLRTNVTGDGGHYTPKDVAIAADSSIFVAGRADAQGGEQGWLGKFSSSGLALWTRRLQTNGGGGAASIAVGSEGSIFVSGGMTAGGNANRSEAFLVRYFSSGDVAWATSLGMSVNTTACCVGAAGEHVFMAGSLAGEGGMGPSVFLTKYSLDGKRQWARQTGLGAYEVVTGIAASQDGDGAVFVAGSSMTNISTGRLEPFLAKFDANGVRSWVRRLRMRGDIELKAVSAGSPNAGADAFAFAAVGSYTFGDSKDGLVTTYDTRGNLLWARQLSTLAGFDDTAVGVTTGPAASLIVTTASDNASTAGDERAYLARYTTFGDVNWTARINTTGSDAASDALAGAFSQLGLGAAGPSLAQLASRSASPTPAPSNEAPDGGGEDAIGDDGTTPAPSDNVSVPQLVHISAAGGRRGLPLLALAVAVAVSIADAPSRSA